MKPILKQINKILNARQAEARIESALEEVAQTTQRHLCVSTTKLVIVDVKTLRDLLEGFQECDKEGGSQ